jgi:hypothetical protein
MGALLLHRAHVGGVGGVVVWVVWYWCWVCESSRYASRGGMVVVNGVGGVDKGVVIRAGSGENDEVCWGLCAQSAARGVGCARTSLELLTGMTQVTSNISTCPQGPLLVKARHSFGIQS